MKTILFLAHIVSRTRHPSDYKGDQPLALAAAQLILDIVDCVPRNRPAIAVLGFLQFGPKHLIVGFAGNLVDDDFLAVVGDLVDDELGLSAAQAEVIECSDALIGNGDPVISVLGRGCQQREILSGRLDPI